MRGRASVRHVVATAADIRLITWEGGDESPMSTSSPFARPSLGQQLTALWPGFPFLGFAALLAWQLLLADTNTWISNVNEQGATILTGSLLIGLQASLFQAAAVVLLVSAPLQGLFRRLLDSKYFTFTAGFVGVLGAASVIFSGPYFFAGPNMLDIRGLFTFGAYACGVAYALLILKSAQLFSATEPVRVLVYYLVADIVAGLLYSLIMCNDFYAPFEGSPPLSGIVGLFVLPVCSALLLGVRPGRPEGSERPANSDASAAPGKLVSLDGIRSLPRGFWKLLAALVVFSLAASFASGWSTELQTLQRIQNDSRLLVLVEMAFDVALLLVAVRVLTRIAFDKLYLISMVGIALALALSPMLGLDDGGPSFAVEFLASIFNLIIWCLLSYVSYRRAASPIAVFGLGYGCIAVGKWIGWNMGRTLFNMRESFSIEFVSLALAIVVLVFLAVVFNARDFSAIFSPEAGSEFGLKDLAARLLHQRQRESGPRGAEEPAGGAVRDDARPWKTACAQLAQEASLSNRETQILEMLSRNMSAEQIASSLIISTNTVRTHTHNIYAKLDVHSRQELAERVRALRDAPADPDASDEHGD